MVFTVDFLDQPITWSLTGTVDDPGWTAESHREYRPTLYAVTARGMTETAPDAERCKSELQDLREDLATHPAVVTSRIERRRPGFRFDEQPVLAIEADRVDVVRKVARFVERRGPPGQHPFRSFDVDFSPEFRFCLDRDASPMPARPPTQLRLDLSREAAADEDLSELQIGKETTAPSASGADRPTETRTVPAGDTSREAIETVANRLPDDDPDILSVERAAIIPLAARVARENDVDLGLKRVPPNRPAETVPIFQRLAGESTFESYGQRRHSPARYNVPGRVVVDRSNTFFLDETNLAGALDLVERSRKPLQELSWASIGNVLTAIQIREARSRGVLVQWHAWRPERFKTAATLHDADRGGTTLSPVVGVHEDVHELDFASLYPNIICTRNLSPETVRCRCHDSVDVPELGYSVCDDDGFLPDVLGPIIDDRAAIKEHLAEGNLDSAERVALEGQSSALKWILVSCFGYQGFSNAKFGRIEVHEAINAYARDILLTAKEHLEAGGWHVLHGIVDSIWVTPRDGVDDPEPIEMLAAEISERVGIDLEYESTFDWVAFCPRRDGDAGALTRYFGVRPDGSRKVRGIESRQRSTSEWVEDVQRDLLSVLNRTRSPEDVCDRLGRHLRQLRHGDVPPSDLTITTRVSKHSGEYTHRTRSVAALERAADHGIDVSPGESVAFVVANDDADSIDRVRLAGEVKSGTSYDVSCYRERAIRATESILSPLGWTTNDIESYLGETRTTSMAAFGGSEYCPSKR
ncbi:type B DNA-directed DNA polymerase [Halapricum sp. CBA1109]|uniref:type B DNA-directed DNA polymerase n=1 Tax=Halapricum sp. CBA1109 TaxID=2668068 RepID=UPI0012F81067|nr:type B DNA-directed DNA polymerase [Halapricum sp. CBA1109]MUV89089.1 type B DNA-directed DNA polymerase [Halapricum sp. CBA1109]